MTHKQENRREGEREGERESKAFSIHAFDEKEGRSGKSGD